MEMERVRLFDGLFSGSRSLSLGLTLLWSNSGTRILAFSLANDGQTEQKIDNAGLERSESQTERAKAAAGLDYKPLGVGKDTK